MDGAIWRKSGVYGGEPSPYPLPLHVYRLKRKYSIFRIILGQWEHLIGIWGVSHFILESSWWEKDENVFQIVPPLGMHQRKQRW